MRMALVLALAMPSVALARAPSALHDVQWYTMHDGVRDATLSWCQSDSARRAMPDCDNAERAAEARLAINNARYAGDLLRDPTFWSANPIARAGVLAQCQRRAFGDRPMLRYCDAARAAGGTTR